MTPRSGIARRALATSPFNVPSAEPVPAEDYAVDDRVSHDRHGLGTVLVHEGVSLVVDFGGDRRRLALPNPKLTKL